MFFFFKQRTAYEMRISDWSADVCSSDLSCQARGAGALCGELDSLHNAGVSCAPADVAGQAMTDLVGRAGRAAQDHVAGDKKHAWRAEAALQAVGLREAAPNEFHQRLILEVFEGLDLLPVDRGGDVDATPNGRD